MKQWTHRQFVRVLIKNGFLLSRYSGDHSIYINEKGRHVSVPHRLNSCIANRLVKENNLNTELK